MCRVRISPLTHFESPSHGLGHWLWLKNLASAPEARRQISDAGGLEPLVALVADGGASAAAREDAAGALFNLTVNEPENSARVVACGGLAPLVALARVPRGTSPAARDLAAACFFALTINEGVARAFVDAGALAPLVELARDGSDGAREDAAGCLRNLAYDDDADADASATTTTAAPAASAIAEAGAIPVLIALARDGPTDAVKESAKGALALLARSADAFSTSNKATLECGGWLRPPAAPAPVPRYSL